MGFSVLQFVCFPLGRRFGEKVQSVRDEVPREYQGRVREVKHFVLVLALIFSVSSRCIDFCFRKCVTADEIRNGAVQGHL